MAEIRTGDRVLVDTAQYGTDGPHWCKVEEIVTTSLFPLRVRTPGGQIGQYRREEIMDIRPAPRPRKKRSRRG